MPASNRPIGVEETSVTRNVRASWFPITCSDEMWKSIATKSSDYTITTDDGVIIVDAGGGITITLPVATSLAGKCFYIKRIDNSGNIVNVDGNGGDLTGAATGLHFDGSPIKHVKVSGCDFLGEGLTHMTGMLLDNCIRGRFEELRFHECKTCIQIIHADSDLNLFEDIDIGDSGIGFDIDAGNEQEVRSADFHHNTKNVDDEVGDHLYGSLRGEFAVEMTPDDFNGIQVNAGVGANNWGGDTEIVAAAAIDAPFRVTATTTKPSANEWFRIRFSGDSGATHYADLMFDANKRESLSTPSGTEFIFNAGTRISASVKSETGGNNVKVWLEIQEI